MTVSSSTNKVSYSGNGSLTTFAYTFKIFDKGDLTVILRAANGAETVQTITTHYTVTGVGDAGGGNVEFVTAPASGVTVVILRELALEQGLDLVPNDPFPAQSLEESLDKLTFMVQQHEEELGRVIKASKTNTIAGSEFTISAADRANKVFAFDSSGDLSITQELGVWQGDWATSTGFSVRDIVKDASNNNVYICLTAHTSSGSTPISSNADSAKWALLVDAASATSSASAAAASETAAQAAQTAAETAQTAAETAQTGAETAQAAAELAYDNFDDRYLGAKASDPTVDNDGSALIDGALYFDTTNNAMKVYDLGSAAWSRTTPTSAEQTNINTVSGIAANVTTVAGISGNVTTVAGISADVTTVSGVSANVTTVASLSADVVIVSGIASDVTTVAANDANVTIVAGALGSGNLTLSGNGSFGGTFNVDGVSTLYITEFDNNIYTAYGDDQDLRIFHNPNDGGVPVDTIQATRDPLETDARLKVEARYMIFESGDNAGNKSFIQCLPTDNSVRLYYNDAQKLLTTNTGATVNGTLNVTSSITGPASFSISADGGTGTVFINGNLTVQGTTTTVNSTTLDVADLNITVADGAANAAAADGAGLTIAGANVVMAYDNASDSLNFNYAVSMDDTLSVGGDVTLSGTGAVQVPSGTEAQRPTAANGMIRYNADKSWFEGYANGAWGRIVSGVGDTQSATTTSTTQTAVASYSLTGLSGIELTVVATDTVATERTITKLLVTHDGTTAVATQYGEVNTNTAVATYDVDISGGNVRLLATAASSNSTNYTTTPTILS